MNCQPNGRNVGKNVFYACVGILSLICKIFELRYLEKYALNQHEFCRRISCTKNGLRGWSSITKL